MPNPIPTASRLIVGAREQNRCLRCGGAGQHWHHRRGRAVKDEHTHCPCNGVLLCRTCHDWCHAHPFNAMETGFVVSRSISDPGQVPVKTWFGEVLLVCDGDFEFKVGGNDARG